MQEILVDRGQFNCEGLVEVLDDFLVAFHGTLRYEIEGALFRRAVGYSAILANGLAEENSVRESDRSSQAVILARTVFALSDRSSQAVILARTVFAFFEDAVRAACAATALCRYAKLFTQTAH
jgi:hypothetical protein